MKTENKLISARQAFRMGILENITLGMVVIPYATLNLAGKWHFLALLIGLLLGGIYMGIIYYLSNKIAPADGPAVALFDGENYSADGFSKGLFSKGAYGKLVCILYTVRFVIRAGIIVFFFAKTVQEYLLQSFNLWVIIISFVVVAGYGASRDIEKRGRMLELLFPWMIVPIILVAVFSISNINLNELYYGLSGVGYEKLNANTSVTDVIKAGYVAFLITTSTELSLFTLPHQNQRGWRNPLKTGLWILISIFLAYIFIIGILGGHWVAEDAQASLNVMEAAFVPGDVVERADYPVLIFWIIGVFAVVSGYMFYSKEAFLSVLKIKNKNRGKIGLICIVLAVIGLTFLWSLQKPSMYLITYMLWADVIISLLIPVIALAKEGQKKCRVTSCLFMIIGSLCFLSGCSLEYTSGDYGALTNQQESIEARDYVTDITFQGEQDIIFTVADIKKYISDGTGSFDTREEKLKGDSIESVMNDYYKNKGRQLDVGHLTAIAFKDVEEEKLKSYVKEMSKMTNMGKSVTVTIEPESKDEKGEGENNTKKVQLPLRQLIKKVYAGENFL